MRISLFSLLVSVLGAVNPAFGGGCDSAPIGPAVKIGTFTYYAPEKGGTNGSPNKSKSGKPARNHYFEDYLEGKAESVMGAVPQTGGSGDLYGGKYRASTIEKLVGSSKCILIIAADAYGARSNGKSKMDIATRNTEDKEPKLSKFNKKSGELLPLGRDESIPMPKRKIARNAAAASKIKKRK